MIDSKAIFLQIYIAYGTVVVNINDIPIFREYDPEHGYITIPINEYLIDGTNTFSLLAISMDKNKPDLVIARARIAEFEHGEVLSLENGQLLAELNWRPDAPSRISTEFQYSMPVTWKWTTAPTVSLDNYLLSELNNYLNYIQGLFLNRDGERLVIEQSLVFEEVKIAYNMETAQRRRDLLILGLKEVVEPWNVMPLPPAQDRYRVVANGRLIDCVDDEGRPLLRNDVDPTESPEHESMYFPFQMKLGLVDGVVKILR